MSAGSGRLMAIRGAAALGAVAMAPGVRAVLAEALALDAPDLHWVLLDARNRGVGTCSVWWTATPPLPGYRVGLVGHLAARGAADVQVLLEHALRELAARGCTLAVGPMNGSTWRPYRLVSRRGAEPPFFLEPDTPPEWPAAFAAAGLSPLAGYCSSLIEPPSPDGAPAGGADDGLAKLGVRIRPLDLDRFHAELRTLHGLSLAAFGDAFLYTPVAGDEFVARYLPLGPYLHPDLVMVAERDGQAVGFVFALPDRLEAARLGRARTAVVKTLAVLPEWRRLGLGGRLVAEVERRAAALGYGRVIHALMHDANPSRRIGGRRARVMRRYALYAREIRS